MPKNSTKDMFMGLSHNLETFIKEVKGKKQSLLATSRWTVKDVLCHIVFWHTYYASNYRALAQKKEPVLLVGPGYMLNETGVSAFRKYNVESLIKKLNQAHKSLYQSIVLKRVPRMTYKQNGRVYKTRDFLLLVTRHLNTHTQQVKRAK